MTRAVDIEGRGVRVAGRGVGVGVGSAIPDSALEQWVASDYDTNNDEWVASLNGNNLVPFGGSSSATKTTDSNGNDVVSYDGTGGDKHETSNVTAQYSNRYVIAIVIHNPSGGIVASRLDSTGSNYIDLRGGEYTYKFSNAGIKSDGSDYDSNIHLLLTFAPDFNSSTDMAIEIDGTKYTTSQSDDPDIGDGFVLGGYRGNSTGFPANADIAEVVVYENPTSTEISDERSRLKSKYDGLSF